MSLPIAAVTARLLDTSDAAALLTGYLAFAWCLYKLPAWYVQLRSGVRWEAWKCYKVLRDVRKS